MGKKSDLPFGSEFSPSQIELPAVLEMADTHGGDWRAFDNAVFITYFEGHATSEYNRRKLANNTKLGMIAYGIIDRQASLTSFGRELLALKAKPSALYERLAKHILLNRNGMTLVRCIQDMVAAGERVTLTTLREGLGARGVHYPSGGKHPSMMRLWLAKAGVFVGSRWQVDPHRVEAILGLVADEFEDHRGLGAKPFQDASTEKLIDDVVEPLVDQLRDQTDPKLLTLLRTPLSAILQALDDSDRYKAGLALEALAFKIMRLLDMTYVATRLHANQTGGEEVDLIFESTRLVLSRWQVQCKNTSRVSLDDVAKEVGLTHFFKSNVVVIVTTGEIGSEARRYANKIMADSSLAVVMISGGDLKAIGERPTAILRAFDREARHAMDLKKFDLQGSSTK